MPAAAGRCPPLPAAAGRCRPLPPLRLERLALKKAWIIGWIRPAVLEAWRLGGVDAWKACMLGSLLGGLEAWWLGCLAR